MARKRILLLSGAPGVGKTTAICKVASALSGRRTGGFYTEEIRIAGRREGFRLVTFDGPERIMAHVDFTGPVRVGKYGVDIAAIDSLTASCLSLEEAKDLYLVDEIGKMECASPKFVSAMQALLRSGMTVVATIAKRGGGFIEEARRCRDAALWEVTRSNRSELPGRVVTWLEGGGAKPQP